MPADVVAAVRESLPPGTVVDGEMIVWDTATGRTTFPALLGRITAGRRLAREAAARPANLVLFDVLADAGDVLTGRPLRQRRVRLEQLLAGAPPALALCPQTSDVTLARTWFDELAVTGSEGLVVKDLDGIYRTGGRGPAWWKYKRRVTAEAVIGGVIGSVDDPRVLLLGRLNGRGRLRYIGRTVPLALSQRQDLGRMLTPAPDGHPWPQPLPATWIGQLDRREPQPYVQVKPLLVAEIVVDQAYDRGRHRHPIHHLPSHALTLIRPTWNGGGRRRARRRRRTGRLQQNGPRERFFGGRTFVVPCAVPSLLQYQARLGPQRAELQQPNRSRYRT